MESSDDDLTFIFGRAGPIGGFNYEDLLLKCPRQHRNIAGNGQCHINSLVDAIGVGVETLKEKMKQVFKKQKDTYMFINMLQYTSDQYDD